MAAKRRVHWVEHVMDVFILMLALLLAGAAISNRVTGIEFYSPPAAPWIAAIVDFGGGIAWIARVALLAARTISGKPNRGSDWIGATVPVAMALWAYMIMSERIPLR